jgi:hypothetical protein
MRRWQINRVSNEFKIISLSELKNGQIFLSLLKLTVDNMRHNQRDKFTAVFGGANYFAQAGSSLDNTYVFIRDVCRKAFLINADIQVSQAKRGDDYELAKVNTHRCIFVLNRTALFLNLFSLFFLPATRLP